MKCSTCKQDGHNKRSCKTINMLVSESKIDEKTDLEITKVKSISKEETGNSVDEFGSEESRVNQYPIVDLRGMGGKEKEMQKLFPTFKRVNHPFYDFIDESGNRYEIKKTQYKYLQSWIDPMKYIDLSEDDKNIIFRFVYYDKKSGKCLEIVDTTLGEIIERFIPASMIEPTKKLLEVFPNRGKLQFKLDIKWR